MTHKCNDYIIRNGEYIREFDKMYQNINDPWDQEKNFDKHIIDKIAFLTISDKVKINKPSILDLGCANGYHLKFFGKIFSEFTYTGTDISPTIIGKALAAAQQSDELQAKYDFLTDDIRIRNSIFLNKYNLIFASKMLYYVAPEIDAVLDNIYQYLLDAGYFSYIYNFRADAFSGQWLTPDLLRKKLLSKNFAEEIYIEINRYKDEEFIFALFKKS